ncbi:MAG: protein kinase, partial [Acidiferrobacterales bacterium]|nr:protein kinase [Acidiferrobacterales bacterium]
MPSSRSPERTEQLRRLVEEAAQRPHSEQAAFLKDSCGDDVLLRSQAEAVLALDAKTKVMQTALSDPPDASDSASRWAKMERLFDLVQHEAPEEREAFLDELCGEDDSLRAELQSLLLYDDEASGYFEDLAEAVIPDAFQQPWLATSISKDADPMLGRRITHYQILERLAGGGIGVVYKALDTLLGRPVALKFLPAHLNSHEATRTRFIHEAKAASALDHANLGYIHEIGESDDGRLFIAMAYYRGETLKKKIEQGPLPLDEALDYAVQIADGLACAHRAGIIHRDIKPANIMVTGPTRARDTEATTQQVSGSSPGVVKIVDFGLAKVHDVGITRTGARLGTVSYMSPEQGRGTEVDHRTDIWALGVVLYEMLTGERPFKGDYEAAVLYAALNSSPPSLSSLRPDLPLRLEQVVLQCLQKDVADRYQDVEMLRSDLEAIRQGVPPIGAPSRPRSRERWPSVQVWQRLFRWPLLAIPLVLGVVLLAVWFSWSNVPEQRHLAVLPFTVIGETTDARAFSAGLLESLTSKLTQIEQYQEGSLWVVPAAEVTASMTPSDARAQLGVTLVVSGSVQMQGERVRLTLNLIDTENRRQIASEQIDHRNTEALALQDEAVLMLARMLRVRLKRNEREELTAGSTEKSQANAFYLRGWGYLRNYQTVEEVELAIDHFRKAIDVDPDFALAYAGLGEAYWQKFRRTDDVQWVDDAIEHSQHALRLNDRLAPV